MFTPCADHLEERTGSGRSGRSVLHRFRALLWPEPRQLGPHPLESGGCSESDASSFSLMEGSTSQSRDVIVSRPWWDAGDRERADPVFKRPASAGPGNPVARTVRTSMVDRSLVSEVR